MSTTLNKLEEYDKRLGRVRLEEIPVCQNDGTDMSPFYDPQTNESGWICDDCGWYFLEEDAE